MSYLRFGGMILTSTVVMFGLMYLNTYAWDHVFFSETRVYMAVLMGATMAPIMLGFMLPMYENRRANVAIFLGSAVVFALSLWLVRSQVTVSGPSYMRAMIPHHSIAVMTSERAQIRDPRVRKLADEITAAQRREIAEMRYLTAEVEAGRVAGAVYHDPPPTVGTPQDALANTLISQLDPAPMERAEAARILRSGARCMFDRSTENAPILWVEAGGAAGAMKLNGVLIPLAAAASDPSTGGRWQAEGLSMTVATVEGPRDGRARADLVFALDEGIEVGYRGSWSCGRAGDGQLAAGAVR